MAVRVCLYCGKEFESKRDNTKFCSHSHNCKYYRRIKAKEQNILIGEERDQLIDERNQRMIDLANQGSCCEEIKDKLNLNISATYIQSLLRSFGVHAQVKPRKKREEVYPERNAEIVKLRKQNLGYREIASALNIDRGIAAAVCRKYGLGGVLSEKQEGRPIKNHNQYVNGFLGNCFTYVGGFCGCDSYVKIQCNKCGYVFEKSMTTIRQKQSQHFVCPHCETLKKEETLLNKMLKREKAAEERRERAKTRAAEKEAEREAKKRTVECKICGTEFVTYSSVKCCCSSECSKKYQNRLSSRRKDKRITDDKRIDKDITALKLYVRDGGKCWICGGRCDTNDYIKKDGVTICGDNYPSVDHIIPVCDGGEDSWDNVRLAHRICNTKRYFAEKVLACCQ